MKPRSLVGAMVLSGVLILGMVSAQAEELDEGSVAASKGDYATAFVLWSESAMEGNAEAQFNLGLMYQSGVEVDQDEARAVAWYRLAASNGHALAQEYMAYGYQEGWFGLPVDLEQARYWYRELAATISRQQSAPHQQLASR